MKQTIEKQWEQVTKEGRKELLQSLRQTIHLLDCTNYDLHLKNQLNALEIKLTKECITDEMNVIEFDVCVWDDTSVTNKQTGEYKSFKHECEALEWIKSQDVNAKINYITYP